ncbi:MAG: hypothetical protein OET90_04925 [Desulfuromonadales bacterium]|nr:hypothetical protein [Desulfuromonadales bacterium]
MLRAMFRLTIMFVALTWASLLLISWSGPPEVAQDSPQPVRELSSSN